MNRREALAVMAAGVVAPGSASNPPLEPPLYLYRPIPDWAIQTRNVPAEQLAKDYGVPLDRIIGPEAP